MATKGTNAKIKELKGVKAEKITAEQLKQVQEVVNNINRTQLEVGSIELKKHELLHGIAGFRQQLTTVQDELEKDYGTFDINIHNGTINYKEDVEADTKD